MRKEASVGGNVIILNRREATFIHTQLGENSLEEPARKKISLYRIQLQILILALVAVWRLGQFFCYHTSCLSFPCHSVHAQRSPPPYVQTRGIRRGYIIQRSPPLQHTKREKNILLLLNRIFEEYMKIVFLMKIDVHNARGLENENVVSEENKRNICTGTLCIYIYCVVKQGKE